MTRILKRKGCNFEGFHGANPNGKHDKELYVFQIIALKTVMSDISPPFLHNSKKKEEGKLLSLTHHTLTATT